MTGVSLPFDFLLKKEGIYGEAESFIKELKECGVQSVEIRTVRAKANPDDVKSVFEFLCSFGLNITVHGQVNSAETAVKDIFVPLAGSLSLLRQRELIITVHPINGDNVLMLRALSDYITANLLPVRIALENNRLLPDASEGDCIGYVADIAAQVNRPQVGICFDMGHFAWSTGGNAGIPQKFRERIIHTHIHAVSDGRTHFPLDCELPLVKYVSLLPHSYYGVYNIELDPPRFSAARNPSEALKKSVRILDDIRPLYSKLYDEIRNSFTNKAETAFAEIEKTDADIFALIQSSSYIFKYSGIKFAMDFALRDAAYLTDFRSRTADIFSGYEFQIITHAHDDHFDAGTVKAMKDLPIKWVIPYFMTDTVLSLGVPEKNIIKAVPGVSIYIRNIRILPFESKHYRPGTKNGVDELGYLISSENSPALLFPGDIRDYSVAGFPRFNNIGYLFAHVWLSDSNENMNICREYAKAQADFISYFSPENVILTHLYESGRLDSQMWKKEHAELIAGNLKNVKIIIPEPGESAVLD